MAVSSPAHRLRMAQAMDSAISGGGGEGEDALLNFMTSLGVERYHEGMVAELDVRSLEHLWDLEDEDLRSIGMGGPARRRFLRAVQDLSTLLALLDRHDLQVRHSFYATPCVLRSRAFACVGPLLQQPGWNSDRSTTVHPSVDPSVHRSQQPPPPPLPGLAAVLP